MLMVQFLTISLVNFQTFDSKFEFNCNRFKLEVVKQQFENYLNLNAFNKKLMDLRFKSFQVVFVIFDFFRLETVES